MELLAASTAGAALVPIIPYSSLLFGTHCAAHRGPSARTSPVPANSFKLQYEPIAVYDVDRLNQILTTELAEFSDFKITYPPARHAVQLYRVTYPSVVPELGNKPTMASGLIGVPVDASGTLPVVSYQHGSVFGKDEVPSNPEQSTETRLMLANFAGQGYILVAADYFGKGVSIRSQQLYRQSRHAAGLPRHALCGAGPGARSRRRAGPALRQRLVAGRLVGLRLSRQA